MATCTQPNPGDVDVTSVAKIECATLIRVDISMYNITSRYRDALHSNHRYSVTMESTQMKKSVSLPLPIPSQQRRPAPETCGTEIVSTTTYPQAMDIPIKHPKSLPKKLRRRHHSYRSKSLSTLLQST